MSLNILLIDDDRGFTAVAQAALKREGFPVSVVHSLHEARRSLASNAFEFLVLDRRLPDGDGLLALKEFRQLAPAAHILIVTAHGDIASAVDAIRDGAADYVAKPVELSDLIARAKRATEERQLRDRLKRAETELSRRDALVRPHSKAMQAALEFVEQVAASPRSPLLLLGETGSGKEVLARHVHHLATKEDAPFIHVNCAALPETTAESELFGHERGAFTDAKNTKRGLVEMANGGTLFLDEVGELSASLQGKLLTFLDSGRFRHLGGQTELSSSARVVAATNRNLKQDVAAGTFRQDLWFRLSVFCLQVPRLKDRLEDIPDLANALLERLRSEMALPRKTLTPEALARLASYPFPGNVRELKNILERALVLEKSPQLRLDWLSFEADNVQPTNPNVFTQSDVVPLEVLERRYVKHVLQLLDGKRVEAAKALGVSYPTFLKKLDEPGAHSEVSGSTR